MSSGDSRSRRQHTMSGHSMLPETKAQVSVLEMLEVLDLPLAPQRFFPRAVGAEVAAMARARVHLARIQPIAAVRHVDDHKRLPLNFISGRLGRRRGGLRSSRWSAWRAPAPSPAARPSRA